MPHDANDNPLAVGDEVVLRAKITAIQPHEEFCNATIEAVHPGKGQGMSRNYTTNCAQLEIVEGS